MGSWTGWVSTPQSCPGSPISEAGGNGPVSLGWPLLGLSFIQQPFTGHLLGTGLQARNNLAPGDSPFNSAKTFMLLALDSPTVCCCCEARGPQCLLTTQNGGSVSFRDFTVGQALSLSVPK